ncbi:alpha/beta fold hydrolase [Terrabacter carboxydivorans]|uniref:alpha/beta fold hydrolase n=1 Tax=Terrabacter carboxydivorans TaxID=619730 RepID=UPI0031D8B46A
MTRETEHTAYPIGTSTQTHTTARKAAHHVTHARLIDTAAPSAPRGIALVLHGGAARRRPMRVSPTQLSVLRMVPIAGRIARAAKGELAVLRLLNSTRGWDAHHTPVDDVRWALRQVADRFGPDLPVTLVGHSLGGRAALLAAAEEPVVSAVALNPWVYPTEGRLDLTGRQVLVVHGDDDRIARPTNSAAVARDLARTADRVGYVTVEGGKHAMLRRGTVFDRLAADFTAATLLGRHPEGVVGRVLDGEEWVDV